jgi:hypothetical protein
MGSIVGIIVTVLIALAIIAIVIIYRSQKK